MTKLKIIFFGSPYYSIPLLRKIISLGHEVPLVISQGAKKNRRGKLVHTPVYEFCKKNNIRINTFMIASDPYLMEFVEKFTEINDGSAYFADLNNLGSMILKDYSKNKIKKY